MIPTIILPPESWPLVQPVVNSVFNNSMPSSPKQSTFLTAIDGEKLAGFVHVEILHHMVCVYVAPDYRGDGELATQLVREAVEIVPLGHSAIWLTHPQRNYQKLVGSVGGRDMGLWRVNRKDVQ